MRTLNLTPEQKQERAREARRRWNAANPEKVREGQRRAYAVRVGHEPRQPSPKAPRKGRTAPLTPEEAKARARARAAAWIKSPAGRAWTLTQREKNRERAKRYSASPEGKAKEKAYRERTKAEQRERHRKWRESQPDYKEKKRLYMVAYHASRHGTPEEIARNRRNGKASYARIMADPVRHAEKLASLRAAYARMKADPVRYARFIERQRADHAKHLARLRADPARHAAYKATAAMREKRKRDQLRLRTKPAYVESIMADVMRMIRKGAPTLHPELRDDLRNDLLADVLAGTITLEQIPSVLRTYAGKTNRFETDCYNVFSLDEVMPGTDDALLIDTIDSEADAYSATPYRNADNYSDLSRVPLAKRKQFAAEREIKRGHMTTVPLKPQRIYRRDT